jgi:hypothetical protein
MIIRNSDIIERMERRGDYSSASEFRNTLRENGHSESDWADRYNPADGAQYSHVGNCAEEAYRDLRYDERREEERQEEEQRQREEEHRYYLQQQEQMQEE